MVSFSQMVRVDFSEEEAFKRATGEVQEMAMRRGGFLAEGKQKHNPKAGTSSIPGDTRRLPALSVPAESQVPTKRCRQAPSVPPPSPVTSSKGTSWEA